MIETINVANAAIRGVINVLKEILDYLQCRFPEI
jgi:hypothetical protein